MNGGTLFGKEEGSLAALIEGQKCKEVGDLENTSGVHMLCIGVTAEALATLASNSFKIFWACNSIAR